LLLQVLSLQQNDPLVQSAVEELLKQRHDVAMAVLSLGLQSDVCDGAVSQFKPVNELLQLHEHVFSDSLFVPDGIPLLPHDSPFAPVVHITVEGYCVRHNFDGATHAMAPSNPATGFETPSSHS
jgi:hypothetical protein